jgi:hypothetical protein
MRREQEGRLPQPDKALVTAADWFAGGKRISYDPASCACTERRVAAAIRGGLRVVQRLDRGRIKMVVGVHETRNLRRTEEWERLECTSSRASMA